MSGDFEQHRATLAHADAAWVFAKQADQPAVRAPARIAPAKVTQWADQFDKSASYAHDRLCYATGANAVRLACFQPNYAANFRYMFGDHAGSLDAAESAITTAKSMPVAERRYNSIAFAHTKAAVASIVTGDLARAVTGINTVLALPSSHRLTTLPQRLQRAQRRLTAPVWPGTT